MIADPYMSQVPTVILVVHGLGGSLIKQALTTAESRSPELCQRVRGILSLNCVDLLFGPNLAELVALHNADYERKDESLIYDLLSTQLHVVRQNFDILQRRSHIEVAYSIGTLEQKANSLVRALLLDMNRTG